MSRGGRCTFSTGTKLKLREVAPPQKLFRRNSCCCIGGRDLSWAYWYASLYFLVALRCALARTQQQLQQQQQQQMGIPFDSTFFFFVCMWAKQFTKETILLLLLLMKDISSEHMGRHLEPSPWFVTLSLCCEHILFFFFWSLFNDCQQQHGRLHFLLYY